MKSQTAYEESLTIFGGLGNRQGIGWALNGLALAALKQGQNATARMRYTESLRVLMAFGDQRGVAASLEGMAAVLLAGAEAPEAVRLLGTAHSLREMSGVAFLPNTQETIEPQMQLARTILGGDSFAACWQEGYDAAWEQAVTALLGKGPSDA